MPRVMISYRNVPEQKAFALELNEAFKAVGIKTWIDVDDIEEGDVWKDAIIDGIKNSDYVALCMSHEYFESPICMMECYIARGYRRKLLPIWIDPDPNRDVWSEISKYIETQGLEYRYIAGINRQDFWGLPLIRSERIQRIINSVANPIPEDKTYDVYISYRYTQAIFATQIADDLNELDISTFIMSKHMNVGDNFHEVGWNAMLQARFHIIILTPDINQSDYIKNEIRVSQTKDTIFIPILANTLVDNSEAQQAILQTFTTDEFRSLNDSQWFRTDEGYDVMIDKLRRFIQRKMQ